MVRVTSVGTGDVLNSRPFTDTVLPVVSEPSPEKSSWFMFERVTTLIVLIAGIAPVNKAEVGVMLRLPVL